MFNRAKNAQNFVPVTKKVEHYKVLHCLCQQYSTGILNTTWCYIRNASKFDGVCYLVRLLYCQCLSVTCCLSVQSASLYL